MRGFSGRRRRFLITALSAAAIAAAPVVAYAQYPVIDNSDIAQVINIVKEAAQQVQELANIFQQVTNIWNAIGTLGSWLSNGTSPITEALTGSTTLNGLELLVPNVNGVSPPSNTDEPTLRTFAEETLFTPGPAVTSTQAAAIETAREEALTEAMLNGYAVATEARADAANTPTDEKNVTTLANNAQNLREDVAALTTATLASLERLNQIETTMAAILEIEATHSIANAPEPYQTSQTSAVNTN